MYSTTSRRADEFVTPYLFATWDELLPPLLIGRLLLPRVTPCHDCPSIQHIVCAGSSASHAHESYIQNGNTNPATQVKVRRTFLNNSHESDLGASTRHTSQRTFETRKSEAYHEALPPSARSQVQSPTKHNDGKPPQSNWV